MGIAGLLNSTLSVVEGLTNFGLGTSAIKNVSQANTTEKNIRVAIVITVLRRLVWITGALGTIITILLASWLSELTFGTSDYTIAFVWISLTLLVKQLTSGQMVLLQGLRKLNFLAKANVLGSFLGLIFTVPLYYFLGIDGIVPGIIITAVISMGFSWYFSRKVKIEKVKVSKIRTIAESKEMLTMGFMISLSGLLAVLASYFVRVFISRTGSLEQVGLYSAGFAIINTYFGLIFKAMGTDYYPRLSAVANDNKLCRQAINQQAEMAILIIAPILIIFLIFINWFVITLYSKKFVEIDTMMHWAALGMFFKATSWSVAFVLLAKGATKLYFWNEVTSNFYFLLLNVLGYHFLGLIGLGISFTLSYLLYLLQMYIVSKVKFQFSFESGFLKIFFFQIGLAILGFILVYLTEKPFMYIAGIVPITFSVWYSIKELDKRLEIKTIVQNLYYRSKK
jgi:O-antigen/teichoic acid export membrane protein